MALQLGLRETAATAHLPRIAGVAALVLALFLYRSWENRRVLGLWSGAYAGVLVCGVLLLGLTIILGARALRRALHVSAPARALDAAVLLWGGAYLLSALDDRDAAVRVVNLNLFGSLAPLPVIAEWLALVLATGAGVAWVARHLVDKGRSVLLSVASVIVLALLGEGVVRLRAVLVPQTQGFPTYTSGQWTRRYVRLNGLGFRDVDRPQASAEGERRLLVVGDSFAFGAGLNDLGDRLGEQLASLLSDRLGQAWRSVNAAVPDSHTLDEIGYLERMRDYQRDAVLLVYVFNDIDYLAPVTQRGVLTEHPSGIVERVHPARLLFLNSYLFQELLVRVRMGSHALSGRLTATAAEGAYCNDSFLRRHLNDLGRFVELASRDGIPVWIAPFNTGAGNGGQFAAIYARFWEGAVGRGLPVLSLADAFDGYDRASLRVNSLDGHPSALANRLAANKLIGPITDALAKGMVVGQQH